MKLSGKFYLLTIVIICRQISAQVTSDFILKSPSCIEEQVDIANTSINSSSQEWDFCLGDFQNSAPISSSTAVPNLNLGYGYKLVEDGGVYYSFIVSRTNSSLLRVFHGEDPLTVDSIQNLGNFGILSNPEGIDIINFNGNWHAVIGSLNVGANITRIEFPDGLGEDLQVTTLGNFDFTTDRKREVKLVIEGDSLMLVFSAYNSNRLIRINYRESFNNTINPEDIYVSTVANLSLITGFDIKKAGTDFIVHAVSRDNQNVIRLNFGASLTNDPNVDQTYVLSEINQSIRLKLFQEGDEYYGLIGSESTNTLVYNFGELTTVQQPSLISHDEALDGLIDLSVVYDSGNFKLGGVKSSSLYLIDFTTQCGESKGWSPDFEPKGLSYNGDGDKVIWLQSFDSDGNSSSVVDTLTILPQTAPSITHTSQEVCVSNPITFTPSNSGLSSYSWDFDGDDIEDSTDPTPSFDYSVAGGGPGPGTYTVRVDVSDGTCDNFYEEEVTIYPDPPVPAFTVTASECVNTDITFTNDTDESQHIGVISYMWDFDNDGTIDSTDPNPTFAYSTPGTKTVVLYDTIPGCSNVSAMWDIDISPGPTAGFTPSTTSACEGDVISFTDTSSGDSQDYFWDFQNGFNSTVQNPPAQLYENSGSYFVSLRTTDAQGCEDTHIQEIAIAASPEINIDFDIPCTSPNGVQFFDLTTVDGADIVSWSWEVDGEEVSDQQNPTINFSTTGVKTIGLTVLSSNGCEQSVTEDIEVLSAPFPDFSTNLGCKGEISSFTDETASTGNPIVSWLWTVDGANYGSQDIDHVFENAGTFDVTLEVTGQNFCSETITKTVEILDLPQVNFALNGECDNQIIRATDQSTPSTDPVVSRRWMLDGANVGNGTELLLDEMEDGTYELELELETEFGCLVSSSQTLEINDAPESSFTSSRTYGIPGDQLTFTNNSTGGVSYQWLLDGTLRSTETGSESITFPNSGNYTVSLVALNSLGCYDTTSQEILIAIPEVDLAIGSFELVDENNTGKIFMEIQNFSNLPIEVTEAQLVLENEFRVSEQILEYIEAGESSLVSLNVGIPLVVSEPSYFCVKLISQYSGYDDINPVNNEKCLTIQPVVQVEDPFPNPVTDQFRLKVVLPTEGTAAVQLINSAGKIHKENLFQATPGLNNFFIDMSTLHPGIYYVTVDVMGNTFKRKVIKL